MKKDWCFKYLKPGGCTESGCPYPHCDEAEALRRKEAKAKARAKAKAATPALSPAAPAVTPGDEWQDNDGASSEAESAPGDSSVSLYVSFGHTDVHEHEAPPKGDSSPKLPTKTRALHRFGAWEEFFASANVDLVEVKKTLVAARARDRALVFADEVLRDGEPVQGNPCGKVVVWGKSECFYVPVERRE